MNKRKDCPKCKKYTHCNTCKDDQCGFWSSLAPMNTPRTNFAAASGPDQNATGTASGVDNDPRVYAIGGLDVNEQPLASCEKYNPNNNEWTQLPVPGPFVALAQLFS